jgi:hypothetical protein
VEEETLLQNELHLFWNDMDFICSTALRISKFNWTTGTTSFFFLSWNLILPEMKFNRIYVFYVALLIWLLILTAMIYLIVYAPAGSSAKPYAFVVGLFFISMTSLVKRAYRFSYKIENRK